MDTAGFTRNAPGVVGNVVSGVGGRDLLEGRLQARLDYRRAGVTGNVCAASGKRLPVGGAPTTRPTDPRRPS